jgi:tetratricopeptide (TPR) repeat protein
MTPLVELALYRILDGNIEDAQDLLPAIEAEGNEAMACQIRGRIQLRQKKWAGAHDYLQRSVSLDRSSPDAWICLGMASYELGFFEKAAECYRRCIILQPNFGVQWMKLGAAHGMLQRHPEAFTCFERAVILDPNNDECHHSLAVQYSIFGSDERAIVHEEKALELNPNNIFARVALGATHLRMGNWLEGWRGFEHRWSLPTPVAPWWYRGQPLYQGDLEGLRGKRVLLRSEQGYGDSIQFCRYAVELSKVASHLILETQGGLQRLFKCLPAEIFVAPKMEDQVRPLPNDQLPPWDEQTSLMSLPLLFGTTQETCPPPVDFGGGLYIRPGKGKVGICWHGGARYSEPLANAVDQRRSLWPEVAKRLLDAIPYHRSLQQEDLDTEDWLETAEKIADLKLVISVDTAVAHLAASMGVPTWLLNRYDSCWRWGMRGDRTPWYPSMRIYRQPTLGDWDSVLDRVIADYKALDL